MARGGFRDVFNGGEVVRAADVYEAREPVEQRSLRIVTGERPKADTVEWVLLGLSSPYFWDCVEYLVDYIETLPKVGRPRQHTVADWVLFWRASEAKSSLRGADDLFVKAGNWLEAREVVAERGGPIPNGSCRRHKSTATSFTGSRSATSTRSGSRSFAS